MTITQIKDECTPIYKVVYKCRCGSIHQVYGYTAMQAIDGALKKIYCTDGINCDDIPW